MSIKLTEAIKRLKNLRPNGKSTGFYAACPVHKDEGRALSIRLGRDNRYHLNCGARCSFREILTAMKLAMADLTKSIKE